MSNYGRLLLGLLLLGTVVTSPLLAKTHRFEVLKAATVNGVKLKPGQYKLVLDGDNVAQIYRGKELLATAPVKVLPLGDGMSSSIRQKKDGTLVEVRLKREKVLFTGGLVSQ